MSQQPDTQYDHLPAFERVASLIRDELIAGQLHAGQTLVEMDLSERFDTSRNTVREALRQLLCEGLVTYQRNKGVTVRMMERSDIKDIYIIRQTLELQAINGGRYIKQEALGTTIGQLQRLTVCVFIRQSYLLPVAAALIASLPASSLSSVCYLHLHPTKNSSNSRGLNVTARSIAFYKQVNVMKPYSYFLNI